MKRPAKPDNDLARWCAVLAEGTAPIDTVPRGWFTCRQIAEAKKRSPITIKKKLSDCVAAGRADKKMFRIRLKHVVRPVAHYRLK